MRGLRGVEHGLPRDEETGQAGSVPGPSAAGRRRRVEDYAAQAEAAFVRSVRAATTVAYEETAWQPPAQVFVILARELAARGIEPEPSAVFDAAVLISRGRRPAVLGTATSRPHRGPVD